MSKVQVIYDGSHLKLHNWMQFKTRAVKQACKHDAKVINKKKQNDMKWPADSFYLARRAKVVTRDTVGISVSLIIRVFMSTL